MIVGRRVVVVGDARSNVPFVHRAGDRLRRDPRHAGDRRLDAHAPTSCSPTLRVRRYGARPSIGARGPARPCGGWQHHPVAGTGPPCRAACGNACSNGGSWADGRITVFLADDNLIVREGVRALLGARGRPRGRRRRRRLRRAVAGRRGRRAPGARHRHPHAAELPAARASTRPRSCASATPAPASSCSRSTTTPSTPISLLADGAAGLRLPPQGPRRRGRPARAGRPRGRHRRLGARPEDRRGARAAGHRRRRAHRRRGGAPARRSPRAGRSRPSPSRGDTTPAAVADAVEQLFLKLSEGASDRHGRRAARLRMLHQAIVDREEQGETLSRLLPGGLAEKLRNEGRAHRRDRGARGHRAHVRHPRLLGHRRARPTRRSSPRQLNEHRAEMNHAILDEGGTVMQFVGDAVMACFGAPVPQRRPRRPRGRRGASRCSSASARSTTRWARRRAAAVRARHRPLDRPGRGRAARLGGAARVHARRRHREPRAAAAGPGAARRAASCSARATYAALRRRVRRAWRSTSTTVKGRNTPVRAYRIDVVDDMERGLADERRDDRGRSTVADDELGRRDARAAQDVRVGGRAGARAARRRLHDDARRVRRGHGAVGLRQVDAAQPRRRPRHADRRRDRRSRASRSSARPRTSSRSCGAGTSASCSSSSTCSRA